MRTTLTQASAALLFLAACGADDPAPARPPNVLLIVVDTLRRDHLSCYGYERATSPHVDALAADGVRFANAYTQAPWTTPAVGSLMTSQYPTTLGIEQDASVLPESFDTLAELLQAAGYATGAVVSHDFCSSRWQFDQGFEWFDDESQVLGHGGISSPGIADLALQYVDGHLDGGAGDERPFFLWTHWFDPHFGYQLHPEFDFTPDSTYDGPVVPGLDIGPLNELLAEGKLGPPEIAELVRHYDSEIAFTDHHIGRLLAGLKERGLYDDLLIVFTADHGEAFLEHAKLGHAKHLYAEALDVPLILKLPASQRAGEVSPDPVSLVDIAPTVLAAAGLPPPAGAKGVDLMRILDGEQPPRPVFSETSRIRRLRGIVAADFKLIRDLQFERFELFDLTRDPAELANLADSDPRRFEALNTALDLWLAQLEREGSSAETLEIPPELEQRLRELGYSGESD